MCIVIVSLLWNGRVLGKNLLKFQSLKVFFSFSRHLIDLYMLLKVAMQLKMENKTKLKLVTTSESFWAFILTANTSR